jgi:hypothetical protein
MRIAGGIASLSAFALAGVVSAGAAHALPNLGAMAPDSGLQTVAAHTKKKSKSAPGACGEMMYYSMKEKKCMDARKKK